MPIITYDQFDVLYKNISSNRGCTVGHFPIGVQASFFQNLQKLHQQMTEMKPNDRPHCKGILERKISDVKETEEFLSAW